MIVRAWICVILLSAAAALLGMRQGIDRIPASRPLDEFPKTLGDWKAGDVAVDPWIAATLSRGVLLNRLYVPRNGAAFEASASRAPIGLFIAYFPTQRAGQSIHSPQNCLPGSGWSFDSKSMVEIPDGPGKSFRAGEYVVSNGQERQEVLYWYRSHGRSIANDYEAKLYTIADAIRYGRTDEALVRIITPIPAGGDTREAHARAVRFAEVLSGELAAYIPD